eukprot:scaffold32257_cov56-Phaeocystis_antarctica.AAC.2
MLSTLRLRRWRPCCSLPAAAGGRPGTPRTPRPPPPPLAVDRCLCASHWVARAPHTAAPATGARRGSGGAGTWLGLESGLGLGSVVRVRVRVSVRVRGGAVTAPARSVSRRGCRPIAP